MSQETSHGPQRLSPQNLDRESKQGQQLEAALQAEVERRQQLEAALQTEVERRQQLEATLQAEIKHRERVEREAQNYFELSLDKQCVVGYDGFFKRLNPAWERSLGFTPEEMMARPYLDFVHPNDRPKTIAESKRNKELHNVENFENRYLCKDGSYRWLSWRARTHPEEKLIYGAARDITESKRTTQVLEAAMAQMERTNHELQQFASIASHDLQEPLRAIQAFGDRLQSRHSAELSAEAQDYLARMQNAATRMRALIQDLLAYSRVSTQVRPFTSVDLAASVRAALADLSIRLEDTGGRVEVGPLPTVEADAMQMRQLFQNLISNALKFHRDGEPPVVKVYLQVLAGHAGHQDEGTDAEEAKEAPAEVHIAVEDNGIGLDEKFAERIFAPFERLHNQRKYGGTGIGLAICRKIVERHRGSVMVKSVLGEGSQFYVVLPVRQPTVVLEDIGLFHG